MWNKNRKKVLGDPPGTVVHCEQLCILLFSLMSSVDLTTSCFSQRSECNHRLVPCQFCDLELAAFQAKEHEEYCGTRTEPCPVCKCNVMLREQHIHPELCGSLTPPEERHSSRAGSQSPGAWFEAHSIHNLLRAQERIHNNNNPGAADRRGPPRPIEDRLHNSTRGTVRGGTRRNTEMRNNEFAYCMYKSSCLNYYLETTIFRVKCMIYWLSAYTRLLSILIYGFIGHVYFCHFILFLPNLDCKYGTE